MCTRVIIVVKRLLSICRYCIVFYCILTLVLPVLKSKLIVCILSPYSINVTSAILTVVTHYY